MKRRIVIYQASRFAADSELLSAIEEATGHAGHGWFPAFGPEPRDTSLSAEGGQPEAIWANKDTTDLDMRSVAGRSPPSAVNLRHGTAPRF